MPDLSFVLAGHGSAAAADDLIAALDGGDGLGISRREAASLPDVARKVVDPIALATLIVTLPVTALAVADIIDRISKRRKAHAVIEVAKRLRTSRQIDTFLLAADNTPRPVADLDADRLLDLAAELERLSREP